MRWIDFSKFSPKPQWIEKAGEVTNKLITAKTKEERTQIIDSHSQLWGELKEDLLELSGGNCWYSEAKRTVSFFDVDHFRPKNNVKNFDGFIETCENSDGYWWLAFDWKNYRVSGEICNRSKKDEEGVCRGKRDYFPLVLGSKVAKTPDDNINTEVNYLLDPTCYEDTCLIAFDETGKPYPAARKATKEYIRANMTCFILHLDYQPIVEQRIMVWNECQSLINQAANIMKNRDAVSPLIEEILISNFNNLKKMVSIKSEFSSTAISCLLQSEYMWARKIASSS